MFQQLRFLADVDQCFWLFTQLFNVIFCFPIFHDYKACASQKTPIKGSQIHLIVNKGRAHDLPALASGATQRPQEELVCNIQVMTKNKTN